MARIDASKLDLNEKVVAINRVSKTVKGGRIFKFAALVVVGDGNGLVGFGLGKASEVPDAIRKGIEDAKKHMIKISLKGTSIPHEVIGKFGAGEVLMMPAPEGAGVIAGGPCGDGGGRHPGYPGQVPALQQPLQRGHRHHQGPGFPPGCRAGGRRPGQDRQRDFRIRRQQHGTA